MASHICQWCNAPFTSPSRKRKFCCYQCSVDASRIKRQTRICGWCKCAYQATGQRNVGFCSRECLHSAIAHKPQQAICEACGKSFTQPKRGKRKTCSKACGFKLGGLKQRTIIDYTCQQCGKTFAEKACRERKFCSKACAYKGRVKKEPQELQKICEHCHQVFGVPSTHTGLTKQRFCSRTCFNEFKRKQTPPCTCKNCGKQFQTLPSKKARMYCSPECYIDYKKTHRPYHLFKGEANLYGLNWFDQREIRRKLDNYECQNCGVHERDLIQQLHVHHIVPFRTFGIERYEEANRIDNLISLCSICHKTLENKPEIVSAIANRNKR